MNDEFRKLELNGGSIRLGIPWIFRLPPVNKGYADAQLDDYGGLKRKAYKWRPGTYLKLRARFSHACGELLGTAGFGFWNTPWGDPTVRSLALPQAVWFFYASAPSDLPLPVEGQGRGWFSSTINANSWQTVAITPLAPLVLLLHQSRQIRALLWPMLRKQFGISFNKNEVDMKEWTEYRLEWRSEGCQFWVGEQQLAKTQFSPKGPLGFVCWLDNQFLVATPTGRFKWGTLQLTEEQWMEVDEMVIGSL